jgi:AcrR family transcriptional regulator
VVAAASSLTRTTVYAHYRSREALLEALVERAIDDGVAAWDARGPHADPLAALEDHLRGSWAALAAQAPLLEAATEALGADRLAQLHGPLHQRVHSRAGGRPRGGGAGDRRAAGLAGAHLVRLDPRGRPRRRRPISRAATGLDAHARARGGGPPAERRPVATLILLNTSGSTDDELVDVERVGVAAAGSGSRTGARTCPAQAPAWRVRSTGRPA